MQYCRLNGSLIRCLFALVLTLILHVPGSDGVAAHSDSGGANSVCPGFVILPNGQAVWSRADTAAADAHHSAESKDHPKPQMEGDRNGHQGPMHAAHDPHGSEAQNPYKHGQAVKLEAGMLCVPVGRATDTAWMAVSQTAPFWVRAESIRGPLTHNSRANEGFRFILMPKDGGQVPDQVDLRLRVRMPQHDHGLPGGHGPANDPDVKGLPVMRDETGTYIVPTIDFTMAGPWLFEVDVKQGNQTTKAYFGADVGEE